MSDGGESPDARRPFFEVKHVQSIDSRGTGRGTPRRRGRRDV
jgi:hypothetical protein